MTERFREFVKTVAGGLIGGALVLLMVTGIVIGGTSTITIKDSAGATQTYFVITNGSGNFLSANVLCDGSAGANCQTVKAASTAPAAADLAAVVAVSPNSPMLTPLTAATATASQATLIGCRYTSTVPALTDTQQASTQFDANCRLFVKDDTIQTPSANFTRPADTTTYAVGDLVANSTTAGSVVPMSFTVNTASGRAVTIERAIIKKSTTGVVAPNFRLHLYAADPSASSGITNGDNGAYVTKQASHFCDIDVNMPTTDLFSDANDGIGAPNIGTRCNVVPTVQTVYGLIESRGAYVPGNAEVFTVTLEVHEP